LLRKIKKAILYLLVFTISGILSLLPKKKTRVIFISDTREELGGNLKFMYDYISDDEYEKIVILKPDRRAKRTLSESIKVFLGLSTAKYIFLEDLVQITSYFVFRKNQELIQLWHGPGAFKSFGFSRLKKNGGDLDSIHRGYRKYTKAIVSGEGVRQNYAEAFDISIDKVYATGFLRTDVFFDKKYIENRKKELYKEYPYFKNKKVILFAPTYRGAPYKSVVNGGANYDIDKLDFDNIYNELKDEYIFIFKWHPALYNNIKNGEIDMSSYSKYKDFYYDLSEFRDINDLLLVTDVLITDYSSVIFDYVLLDKPIVYFTYDLDEYANGRGMYYPFKDYVFGAVAETSSEMVKAIKKEDMLPKERKIFMDKFVSACDGKSIEKTYKLVFENEKVNK
jgi:Putative glycosyl/glycerophosphate transferases involved in teichoic acid biosynthesis TagF/TagB/EpsJ/RodC